MRTRYNWPPLEGVESLDAFAVIESGDAEEIAALDLAPIHAAIAEVVAPVPAPRLAAPPAAQWLEILTAIRRDIQELRAEHRAEILADSDDSTEPESVGASAADGTAAGGATNRPRSISPGTPGSASDRPKAKRLQSTQAPTPPARKRKRTIPPKQDEWGFFDPDQCGFAALLAKLEEIEGD